MNSNDKTISMWVNTVFSKIAEKSSNAAGTPAAFMLATAMVVLWGATGPLFRYSEMWQIVINTATTIITFLLVFLIQNSQNRETRAIQLKLNELIRATQGAHNSLLHVETLNNEELNVIYRQYEALAQEVRQRQQAGKTDQDVLEIVFPNL